MIDVTDHAKEGLGCLVLKEGREPEFIEHEMPDAVIERAVAYFDLDLFPR